MSLSAESIEWLFGRLNLTYGRDFLARYEGMTAQAVMGSWAHELAAFGACLHVLDWALDHLPVKPPSVLEFRALCRAAPATTKDEPLRIGFDRKRSAAALEEMAQLASRIRHPQGDRLAWARQIVARHAAGDKPALFALKAARSALRIQA